MRNQYPGKCYRCGCIVETGKGHFERFGQSWRLQHASCAIEHRGTPDPARQALNWANTQARASQPGKRGQRVRQKLAAVAAIPFNREDF